jgi:very-short-patch-repair endonuclease
VSGEDTESLLNAEKNTGVKTECLKLGTIKFKRQQRITRCFGDYALLMCFGNI